MKGVFVRVIASISFLVVFICCAGSGVAIHERDPFFVSIVRPDGVLRPFAVFDSGEWSAPWPDTFRMKEPYESKISSLADIPRSWYAPLAEMPSEWYVLETSGNKLKSIVSKPIVVRASCAEEWGLLSDYPPRLVDLRRSPLIKEGIAVSQPVLLSPFQEVRRYTYEWREFRDPVLAEFKKAEKELPHPSPENIRATRGMSVQKLIRPEITRETPAIYYFEAEKEYWKEKISRRGGHDYDIGFLKGWIIRADGQFTTLLTDFRYGSPYGIGIGKEQPLGIIVVDGLTYWVQEHKYYESEAYMILRVSRNGIEQVLKVQGGGC